MLCIIPVEMCLKSWILGRRVSVNEMDEFVEMGLLTVCPGNTEFFGLHYGSTSCWLELIYLRFSLLTFKWS